MVVHAPRHVRSLAELTAEEIGAVAAAWAARAGTGGYVHPLINEGRAAGGSLPHSHSQLVGLRDHPGDTPVGGQAAEGVHREAHRPR